MPEPTALRLATCRYRRFQPRMGFAVRATVGAPRYKLDYPLAGHAVLISPTWPMLGLDRDEFQRRYLDRLARTGLDAVAAELAGIAAAHPPGPRLVLLCYEDLSRPGAWCHRTLFGSWWHSHTGVDVPEFAEPAPTGLFDLYPEPDGEPHA